MCICIAIDAHKSPVVVVFAHGMPGSARMRKAKTGRIAPGSLLIRGLEWAYGVLVREGGLECMAYRADVNDPVCPKRMEIVNDLSSGLKRYLWRFTGGGRRRTSRRISTGTSTPSGST